MRILGLDPGLLKTGWGIVCIEGNRLQYVAHGVVVTPAEGSLASRLAHLFRALEFVLAQWVPDEAAVEETFVNKNPASTLKLGSARGVVLLVPALQGKPVYEYAANQIKKAVVGVGHASKEQVAHMVQILIPTAGLVKGDAADALAVAICHSHMRQTQQKTQQRTSI